MPNIMTLNGIVNRVRSFDNDNGSKRLYLVIASQSHDWRRRDDKNARDFWNVDLLIPASRANVAKYIVPGRIVTVSGIPYQSKKGSDEDQKTFVNIDGKIDLLDLHGMAFKPKQEEEEGNAEQGQQESQQEEPEGDSGPSFL